MNKNYEAMVKSIAKSGDDILMTMNPIKAELCHMGLLVTSEAGEFADAIKKFAVYGKPLDIENVKEELGDLAWAMTRSMQILDLTWDEVLAHNADKLVTGPNARYKSGSYSDEQAINRADKTNEGVDGN